MKFSLLAVALVAITLTACDRPKQPNPEGIEEYGTRTEEGTTVAEERAAAGPVSEIADPEKFKMDNVMQAEEAEEAAEVAAAAAAGEDEYSGKAVLPGHNLDGNGNPIIDGKDPTKLMH